MFKDLLVDDNGDIDKRQDKIHAFLDKADKLLNAYYSGTFLNYSIREQLKDIFPSFLIALVMAVIVYAISFINLAPVIVLIIQILVAFAVVIVLCELTRLDAYVELKDMAAYFIKRNRNGK